MEQGSSTWTWVDQVSEGGLYKPTESFLLKIIELEKIFIEINNNRISIRRDYLKYHLSQCDSINAIERVKRLFFRCRLYFRLKKLNKNQKKKIKQNNYIKHELSFICIHFSSFRNFSQRSDVITQMSI